jgi:hypothetical protein
LLANHYIGPKIIVINYFKIKSKQNLSGSSPNFPGLNSPAASFRVAESEQPLRDVHLPFNIR